MIDGIFYRVSERVSELTDSFFDGLIKEILLALVRDLFTFSIS
jgi:hypothetical protein